jgi:ssDNA-binding Zn-finger/Zn-ribbon topoisomerase 1
MNSEESSIEKGVSETPQDCPKCDGSGVAFFPTSKYPLAAKKDLYKKMGIEGLDVMCPSCGGTGEYHQKNSAVG